ncbi:OmpH family outer membrane protein [Aestuariibacter salexigens]|uniref:OmpH family outer membrane protein n=1 Tax=Aestuariibacter salexigens TaxID=226010 RepID=UPI0004173E3B|nr:OmpH family outer membrane protein [Aestuariibacter salexigens]
MKRFVKTLAAAAVVSSAVMATPVMAEQKIAVVDVQGVFRSLPQAAEIAQKITDEFKERTEELRKIEGDGNFLVEKLQREAPTMSEQQQQELRDQIIALQQQLQEKGQPLQQEIQQRRNEEQGKVLGLIRQSIEQIAASQDYDMVLNANAVIYAKPDADISNQVLEQVSKIN